ncbi:MAG: MFS transporter [Deltaproteobacteria bacterium]|nr:MFS transporter [Deltaproteobacteria bacterium]
MVPRRPEAGPGETALGSATAARSAGERPGRRWVIPPAGVLLTITSGHLVHDVYSSFLALLLPLLITKFSLSMLLAGGLTLFFRLPFFLTPLLGVWAEGRDLSLAFALTPAGIALSMCLLGLPPSYLGLGLLLLAGGVAACLCHLAGPVIVANLSGSRLGRGMAWWMTAGEVARTLGPLAAVAALEGFGLPGLWPLALPGVLVTVALIWLSPSFRAVRPPGERPAAAGGWRELLPLAWPVFLLVWARTLVVSTLVNYLPTYLVGRGEPLWFGGVALTLLEGAGVLGTLGGGQLSDRWGRRPVLAFSLVVPPALVLALVHLPAAWAPAVLILLGLAAFSTAPVTMAVVQESLPSRRSAANGLYMGVSFSLTALVLLAVGWAVDHWGFDATLTVGAVVSWTGLAALPLIPRRPAAA